MGDENGHIHLPDHTQPSDYSDMQPSTYDPEFISQISSKMQVPDRISVGLHAERRMNGHHEPELDANNKFVGMSVPDKIVLAGENQHIGMRQDLALDISPNNHVSPEGLSYVGLITPPRVLTLDETFPSVDQKPLAEDRGDHSSSPKREISRDTDIFSNGGLVGVPEPYDPGVSLNDSLLLNEEDEATLLRTQVAKLTRRMHVIEHESQKRGQREMVLYPALLGYLLWKVLGWFARDR